MTRSRLVSPDPATLALEPDAQVVAYALAGSDLASREIVRRYERPVLNLVARLVQDRAAAEDLSQDTFLKVFRSLGGYDARWRFSAWILKIAHNTALDFLRRQRPYLVPLDEPGSGDRPAVGERLADTRTEAPDAAVQRTTLAQAVDAAIDRLRPEYRQVLVLRYQEELEYDEISRVLELPLGTVKTFIHRARRALADALADAGWGRRETRAGGGT